ncbi:11578_t:CDS:10 [Dentiscutata heterogama]|uniref:11578_t:CDS:1 n=1 Tax=Dentiscutata heterogama TaxID=1316150 RepID=A0ACA9JZZ9_9GLOM|nr:11578_t:CDS:10 [Dentiscutata heterogama]
MNPIKLSEYENYKESQKRIKKDVQWNEFLKLDKKQYLNFRNDLRNRAASQFLHSVSLTRQPKGKAEEVIKEFNEANSTFLVSEAGFVLHDWLTSYCNSMARAKGYALPPKKKNVQPPIRRCNTNCIDVESTPDQSDTDEMSDNAQSPFENNDNINDNTDESVESDALTTTNSAKISQKNTSTLMKNMLKRRNSQPCKQGTAISGDGQDNTDDESDILSSAFLHADIVNDHQNVRNLENDEPGSEDGQDNTDDEPDALTTASSAFSNVDIGQENTSTLKKNKNLENDEQGTVISEYGQDNTNESILEPDALTTTSSALHADNGQENTFTLNIRNLEDNEQGIVISENDQDNTNESVLEPDALMTASSALHTDVDQENASTLKKNKSKKRNSVPIRPRSTNIKVNDYLNVRNLENNEQSTVIPENNVLPSLRKSLRSSVRKFNNIKTVSKIVEGDAQDSGKKRKENKQQKRLPRIV